MACGVPKVSTAKSASGGVEARYSEVEVVEGDKFVEAHGLPPPSAVKIDVEGYEYAVLRGLRRTLSSPSCKLVCCEIHSRYLPAGVVPEDVIRFLMSLGFLQVRASPSETPFQAIAIKPPPEVRNTQAINQEHRVDYPR